MWTQLHLIPAVLLPIFTHVTAILCGQVVHFSQKTCGEKIAAEHVDTAHLFKCGSASSAKLSVDAELSVDTCGKKSQCVALALDFSSCTYHLFGSLKEALRGI